ncbi:hypothetical protein H0R94_12435 [Treponema socranskii]|uniref:hypothetical protein n=1 Tax=Treponema socranskii TaxID=53419 RepID=UPI003D8A38A7
MKKAIFAAAAIFFGFVFLSCSDVFGGRETEGIAFTVPPLAPQSVSSPARAAAGVSEGPWSIYGFLFGEDADPGQIQNFVNPKFSPLSADKKGLIQAVSLKGADISRPQPLFFQRIPAKTKCFVCILVTYTTSARTEHIVFSGISPDSVLSHHGANPFFTDNFYTPDTGENEISVTLKKNTLEPVYFATQNGASGINSSGQSTYSPQESTPYKPTHFYGMSTDSPPKMTGALGAVRERLAWGKAGVIILMDDIDVSNISITTESGAIPYLNGRSVDFDSISGKRCKLKAKDFSVSSGRYLSFTDVRIEGTVSPTSRALVDVRTGGELRLGGAVTLEDETKIQLGAEQSSPGQNGKIVIVSPLADDVGKVIVEYRDSSPTEAEEHAKADMQTYPILRDDTGANTQVPDFFDDEVKVVYSGHHFFTARWKRKDGNSWVLEARD